MAALQNKRPRRYLRSRITRKLIIDTARSVFLSEGYSKTTVAKISKEANVGYGTIYSHFKGKDDIINNAIDRVLDDCYSFLETGLILDSNEKVKFFFNQFAITCFQLAHQHSSILGLYKKAMAYSESITAHWEEVTEWMINKTASYLTLARESGMTGTIDPHTGAKAFILLIENFIWEVVSQREGDPEQLSQQLTDLFFRGFFVTP